MRLTIREKTATVRLGSLLSPSLSATPPPDAPAAAEEFVASALSAASTAACTYRQGVWVWTGQGVEMSTARARKAEVRGDCECVRTCVTV